MMKAPGLSSVLLGLGFISSLFFYGTDSPIFVAALGFCLAGAAILTCSALRRGAQIHLTAPCMLMVAWGVYYCVLLPLSAIPYLSGLFTLIFLCVPLLFLSVVIHPDCAAIARRNLSIVMSITGVLAVHALMQFIFFHDEYSRARSVLLDPNTLAALLNMLFMPLLAGFFAAANRRAIQFCGGAAALVFAALLATESRGGLICAVAGFAVVAGLLRNPDSGRRRIMLATAGSGIVFVLIHIFNVILSNQKLSDVSALMLTPGSVTDRLAIWQSSLALLKDHFFSGTGLGTFAYYYGSYRIPADRSDGYFVHMDSLQMATESGIGAALVFYALAAFILIRTIKALRNVPPQSPVRVEIVATFAGLLTVILHSHIYFHLYMPVILLPLACLLAAWYSATSQILSGRVIDLPAFSGRRAIFSQIIIALMVLVPLQWVVRVGAGAFMIRNAATALYSGNPDMADLWTARAEKVAPPDYFHVPQYRVLAGLARLKAAGNQMSVDQRGEIITKGLRDLAVVDEYNKAPAFTAQERAALYVHAQDAGLMLDGYARAIDEFRQAVQANPRNFAARMMLASILSRRGEVAAAKEMLEEGLSWPAASEAEEVNYMIAVAEIRQTVGDDAGAQDILRRAADKAQAAGLIRN